MIPTISEEEARRKIQEIEQKKKQVNAPVSQPQPIQPAPKPAINPFAQGTFSGAPGTGAPAVKIIAHHKLSEDDTLSAVALKYYHSAAKPY